MLRRMSHCCLPPRFCSPLYGAQALAERTQACKPVSFNRQAEGVSPCNAIPFDTVPQVSGNASPNPCCTMSPETHLILPYLCTASRQIRPNRKIRKLFRAPSIAEIYCERLSHLRQVFRQHHFHCRHCHRRFILRILGYQIDL